MEIPNEWLDSFYEVSQDLIQDVLLLEGMVLRMERTESYMTHVPQTALEGSFFRLMNYLSQHTEDLYLLDRQLAQGVMGAPATDPG